MCKMLEDMRNEAAREAAEEAAQEAILKVARNLIKAGNDSLEQIADATNLPLDTVKKLEAEITSLA